MTTKRAYKLHLGFLTFDDSEEFVAHSSSVNCLKIGRKSSRVLVTGGEDHKVNLWAIGKPNALLSLSGHTSAIESVSFDSSELFVAAGAASGTIKLWDLEEAKGVRTLTGHRSNCISVDFHPFGEIFASGSLDTNLKIWDLRKKGCIHTYKGHTRGVNAIRFTPDGRWVVSGGEDNLVKLWDLTAGKLLHDFKCHEGQIQCIDFHPREFLLATGSADRTCKFWDLETFELIGSAGPEAAGVRCMTFNPDGRTLLCGLHESLKVFTWEPVRCHDAVDVGWSRLSDLNVHERKLLGCSYNQSCVGVWVVDISRIEPYAVAGSARLSGQSEAKSASGGSISAPPESVKAGIVRLSVSQSSEPIFKDIKPIPSASPRVTLSTGPKTTAANTVAIPGGTPVKRVVPKIQSTSNIHNFNKSDVVPVMVPRTSARVEQASDSRKETVVAGRTISHNVQSKVKQPNSRDDLENLNFPLQFGPVVSKSTSPRKAFDQNFFPSPNDMNQPTITAGRNVVEARNIMTGKFGMNSSTEPSTHENYDTKVRRYNRDSASVDVQCNTNGQDASMQLGENLKFFRNEKFYPNSFLQSKYSTISEKRYCTPSDEKETVSASDEDAIADVAEQHGDFLVSMQSRLTKVQVIRRLWERNDIKGAITALENMSDHAVVADVVSIIVAKSDIITLEICTCMLPLLTNLLESKMDRHLCISLEMLLKLVRIFDPVIQSTLSASSSVGVDLQAEQRLERCNICFLELKKIKQHLPSLARRGGSVAKSAQELNLALMDVH